ncbi:YaaA family protein [Demetria terragena]|uniref:YaaA family protein n=1 Tax=Demetria terragena TaxID=63959 RepID=UPI00058D6C59|nr:peroxide stress protein YaaA [Demetria terragena]
MLILLPPSETKQTRPRGRATDLESLSFPELTAMRQQVTSALGRTSALPDAATRLGVSPNLTDEIARNTALESAPAVPAEQLYTGVLYDALDVASLPTAALRRARRWLVVISAAYGAVHLRDKVAPYRCSMAVNLEGVGPLASAWRPHLASVLPAAAHRGLIVDCRSSTYVSAWQPTGDLVDRWVQIHVPGATHMAKHTRGLVARAICEAGVDARSPHALREVLADQFTVDLAEPTSRTRPWVLSATPRPRDE